MVTIAAFCKDVETKEIAAYESHPLFSVLKDTGVDLEIKLRTLVKHAGIFAMNFKVLNNEVLAYTQEEGEKDPMKATINRHCKEDGNHWPFWCHDNEALGGNVTMPLNDALKWVFGHETAVSRSDVPQVAKWIGKHGDNVYARYVLISIVELHGDLIFGHTLPLVHKWQAASGKRLDYFGDKHRELEQGTLMHQSEDAQKAFDDHVLTSAEMVAAQDARAMLCGAIHRRWAVYAQAIQKAARSGEGEVGAADAGGKVGSALALALAFGAGIALGIRFARGSK